MNEFLTTYRPEIGQVGIAALYALSLYVVMAGQLSLAQAAFGAIAAYTSVLLTIDAHWPFPLVLLAGMAASTVAAGILSVPLRRLRGVFLAIATIAFGEMIRILIINLDFTGGANGIVGIPPKTQLWHIYLALAVAGYLVSRLAPSRLGRQMAAAREDELAASLQGIDIGRVRVLAFLMSGALAGLAGALDAHFSYIIEPQNYGSDLAIRILTWGVIGGSTVWFGHQSGAPCSCCYRRSSKTSAWPLAGSPCSSKAPSCCLLSSSCPKGWEDSSRPFVAVHRHQTRSPGRTPHWV